MSFTNFELSRVGCILLAILTAVYLEWNMDILIGLADRMNMTHKLVLFSKSFVRVFNDIFPRTKPKFFDLCRYKVQSDRGNNNSSQLQPADAGPRSACIIIR